MHSFNDALMDLTVVDGEVLSQDGRPFDRVAYSHFKYGHIPPAIQYGRGLAGLVGDRVFAHAGNEPITIVSAPYKHLPTASHVIAQSLTAELSHQAVVNGQEPPVLVPFHKTQVGDSSYAKSSESDRLKALSTLGLQIDERRVTGAHVLVVDDIRITGTAEKATAAYLESLAPASIWYLHAARLNEGIGKEYPHLEDELNQTVAHTPEVFLQQWAAGEFQLNTRVLRLILEFEGDLFTAFIAAAPNSLLEHIYQSAIGNGPAYYARYRDNLELLYIQLGFREYQSING